MRIQQMPYMHMEALAQGQALISQRPSSRMVPLTLLLHSTTPTGQRARQLLQAALYRPPPAGITSTAAATAAAAAAAAAAATGVAGAPAGVPVHPMDAWMFASALCQTALAGPSRHNVSLSGWVSEWGAAAWHAQSCLLC
jgi:hypothetical protein